jgi:UDP-N-acetylmuramoylalanine--D-glutamate ligase
MTDVFPTLLSPTKTIFILELSSYQLDDIKYSPNVAVVTNIFSEHIDYHYNIKNYYAAKKNIIKFQNEDDIFIYNHKV